MSVLLVPASLLAQIDQTNAPDNRLKADAITLKIEAIEASTTLDEQTASTLVDLYRRALTNLESARSERAAAEELSESAANAPEELERVRQSIELLQTGAA